MLVLSAPQRVSAVVSSWPLAPRGRLAWLYKRCWSGGQGCRGGVPARAAVDLALYPEGTPTHQHHLLLLTLGGALGHIGDKRLLLLVWPLVWLLGQDLPGGKSFEHRIRSDTGLT